MAFFRMNPKAGGGGGGSTDPVFESVKICDNSTLASSLTFIDDFTNYEFLKFVIYNSSSQLYTEIITTPEMVTNAFTYSNNLLNLNEANNDQYCCYNKVSNTSWTRYGRRNCDIYEVYGMTCSNKTVTKTTIYNRQAIGGSSVTITSQTSLFSYDYLLFGSCTGSVDETQPCNEIFKSKNDIFGRPASTRTLLTNGYNTRMGILRVSEYQISAWNYHFFVQGVTFT